jgi:hypothetical protein
MVIKNYKIKGGFSQYIASHGKDEVYEVKSLMGKGLGLAKHGTHVAFAGGTGILTFIDIVSLLARVDIGQLDPEEVPIFTKGSTFKFILYASFRSRRDSIALNLLESFDKLCQ